jgi:hypothetical protein
MDGSDFPPPVRDRSGRFAAGNPGRPFGSRNRMSKRLARAILKDFEAGLDEMLPRMRQWFLPLYIGMVTRLLPKVSEAGGFDLDDGNDIELNCIMAEVRRTLDAVDRGEATLEDLENAMLGARRRN